MFGLLHTACLIEIHLSGIYIVAAKRTPFGTMGGIFVNTNATELSVAASKAAIQAAGIRPEKIDSAVFGHIMAVSVCTYVTDNCNSMAFTHTK